MGRHPGRVQGIHMHENTLPRDNALVTRKHHQSPQKPNVLSGKALPQGLLKNIWQGKKLSRNMWIGDGAGQGLHFSNFSKHGLVRNVLGTILEKVKPRKKPYQEYVDF